MSPTMSGDLVHPAGYLTNPPPSGRPVRIFVHGVFDLFHQGHLLFLEVAKNMFPETFIIVGVTTDRDTARVKGITVINAADRATIVRGCKYVDEVIENCEPTLTPRFMDEQQIDYFAHADTANSAGWPDPYRFIKEEGKFLVIPRIKDWGSTTQIISRVIRDRDDYVFRQLKNGATLDDMRISWLKFQWIKNQTLIVSKSGTLHGNDETDWKWWHESVPIKLRALALENYTIVISSNQGRLTDLDGNESPEAVPFKRKMELVLRAFEIPVTLLVACANDLNRKPRPGLWPMIPKLAGRDGCSIDKAQSYVVGDAAGRERDFSDSDLHWAMNAGIPFYTPEEFFLGEPRKPRSHKFHPEWYLHGHEPKECSSGYSKFS
ncbi:putative choline-phosphate cytidylyltransferase [Paramyrothecium foliicola]|nr:putative choline-phosphate cytidylyltransferase [Paramyrothecium foliicola]